MSSLTSVDSQLSITVLFCHVEFCAGLCSPFIVDEISVVKVEKGKDGFVTAEEKPKQMSIEESLPATGTVIQDLVHVQIL